MAPSGREPVWHVEDFPIGADTPESERLLLRECRRAVDPCTGPLIRAVLLCYRGRAADLVLVASHLAVDERSMEAIVTGLLSEGPAPEESGNYPQWAAEARDAAAAAASRAVRLREEFSVPTPALDWGMGDHTATSTEGGRVPFSIPGVTWWRLTAHARKMGITANSVLLAAVGLVGARNGGVPTTLVGATVNRRPPREHSTVGYFNNTVVVPVCPEDRLAVSDYLHCVHQRSLHAYRDADLPLSDVLPPTAAGLPPTLQVAVVPYRRPPVVRQDGMTAVPHPDPDLRVSQFAMTCYVDLEAEEGPLGFLQFQRRWFTHDAAELFARQVVSVIDDFAAGTDVTLETVTALSPQDTEQVLDTARGPEPAFEPAPVEATITQLFTRRAAESPDRIAVTDTGTALRYRELDERSSALAQALVEAGVAPGDRVGVRMDRSCELVVSLLAVMKAGAAYVPLDPDYPKARLAFISEDAGLSVIIGESAAEPGTDALAESSETDRDMRLVAADAVPSDPYTPLPGPSPDSIAYVIHTSGSTGRPKGVLVTHRNVASLMCATQEELALGSSDVWTLFHSFAFDFSVWEIWGCLLTGGRLVVVPYWVSRNPEDFHLLLEDEEVTVLSQTPIAFGHLTAADHMARGRLSVRLLVFGGESLDPRMLLPWFDRYPVTRVENMYGITEATVHCTWHTVSRADALARSRSVGRPLPGWQLYVLDLAGRLVAPGVQGEIYVGGAGITRGYLDRLELTAERFIEHRLGGRPVGRLYRSGDRGRYLPDGRLEHLGRLDSQVKIRGFRIELGEIRNVLLEDPAIQSAAVVVHEAQTPEARLDAYVVLETDDSTVAVWRRVADRLPDYMVPATVTALPELPLTSNGKLDTARLPASSRDAADPDRSAPSAAATGEPNDITLALAAIWQEVLGVPVGTDDNFFDLGGNSLLAVRLNAALQDARLPAVQLREIFRHATPARMAELLRTRIATVERSV